MRKQYHFRPGEVGFDAWDVDRLIELASGLPTEEVSLDTISELDTDYWFDPGPVPTVRRVVEHVQLVNDADLAYPIIVSPDGRVMDGMHRVARALIQGRTAITAVRLPILPEPDHRNCLPDDLPYD